MTSSAKPPVLLVHGIWDDGARFARMRAALERARRTVRAVDLVPNDGSAPIERLAEQVERAADELVAEGAKGRLDLVGFSMGALVSRYWLQRMDGRARCRRFVSISGPHAGTVQARWLPFLAGVRQMTPGSPLLVDLAADAEPFGEVEAHSVWSPYDLMIVPPTSSRLRAAREHRLPILLHRWMISDARVIGRVREILECGDRDEEPVPRRRDGGGDPKPMEVP